MCLPCSVKQSMSLKNVNGSQPSPSSPDHPPLSHYLLSPLIQSLSFFSTTEAHLLPISAMVSGILVQCTLALSVGLEPGRCTVAALIDIS